MSIKGLSRFGPFALTNSVTIIIPDVRNRAGFDETVLASPMHYDMISGNDAGREIQNDGC